MIGPEGVRLDQLAGGVNYMLGAMLEGAPVKWDGRTVGHVQDGKITITDPDALKALDAGEPMEVSISPDPGAMEGLIYGP